MDRKRRGFREGTQLMGILKGGGGRGEDRGPHPGSCRDSALIDEMFLAATIDDRRDLAGDIR